MAARKKQSSGRGPARSPVRGKAPAEPAGRGPKPAGRAAKPAGRGSKPAGRAAKPAGRGAKPIARGPAKPRGGKSSRAAANLRVTPLENAPLDADGRVRINRFLASAGVCSRRAADALVGEGRVSVNGEAVTELGTRIDPATDDVRVDDVRVQPEKPVYVLFNKPKGVVCTNASNEQRQRVIDLLPEVRGRVYTVGRLDAESEGLILLTNDGEFAQRVAHPRYELAKTYAVLLRGRVEDEQLHKARGGVWLAEGRTTGARIVVERRGRDRTYLKVSLREGRNREIRRIFAKLGFPVLSLKRVRIGQLTLHGLRSGRYRFLKREEVDDLLRLTNDEGDPR